MPGNTLGKILLISLIENTIKIEFENKIKMAITRNVSFYEKKIRQDKDYYFGYEDTFRIYPLKIFFGGFRMETIFYRITFRYKHRLFKV